MSKLKLSYKKPTVKLVGEDGSAFAIMSAVKRAMKKAGATEKEVDSFLDEATSGKYDNLLQTTFKYVNPK